MKVIDNILLEWSYRCPDGIVDLNNPEKAKILFEILNEVDSKQELIDLINTSELSPEQISKLKKYVAGRVSASDTNTQLEKILTLKGLKRLAPLVVYSANNFDVEDRLLDYMRGEDQPTLSNSGNLFTLFSKSGLPEDFLKKITQITSNQLGAGELLLITMLKNAKKLQAKSGQGDIQVGDEIIELKGKGATLSEWGSKTPIKNAFLKAYGITDEKELSQITKNDEWLNKLGEDLKTTENKEKAENVLRELYPNFKLDTSSLDKLKKSIAEGFADQYFKDSKITSILVLDEITGNYQKFSKEDFKNELGNKVQYFFTKDTAPRIYLRDEQTKVDEGVTVDGNILNINVIKSTDSIDDPFLINRDKKFKKVGNIPTYYGISPNPNNKLDGDDITDIYDNTKDVSNISTENLYKLILLTAPSIPIHSIIALPSSAKLNTLLLSTLQQKYKVSDENILSNIYKIEYFIDDMINPEKYAEADPTTQKMASTWIRSLKKRYPDNPKMPIKKSKSKTTGHPGIQSGARSLLNPVYAIDQEVPTFKNILVVDDFLIGGTSLREVYKILIDKGVPQENIIGYCLGIK